MRTMAQKVGRAMVLAGALALLAFGWLTLQSIRAQRDAGRELDRLVTGSRLGGPAPFPRQRNRDELFSDGSRFRGWASR